MRSEDVALIRDLSAVFVGNQAVRCPSCSCTVLGVRSAEQSASPFWCAERVNTSVRMLGCALDAEYPRARAVRAERCFCLAGPPDQSAGVVHDEYRRLLNARSTRSPETVPTTTDPSALDP